MKCKINRTLLPIKAHYFFFFAALGPILPQINVYGKELGISPAVMGIVTSILPFLWALAKPAIGFLVDYFYKCRKFIFMCLIFVMSGSYLCMYFLPEPPVTVLQMSDNIATLKDFRQQNNTETSYVYLQQLPQSCQTNTEISGDLVPCINYTEIIEATCGWICTMGPMSLKRNLTDEENHLDKKFKFWVPVDDIEAFSPHLSILYYNTSTNAASTCDDFNMIDYADQIDVQINKTDSNKTNNIKCTYKIGCKFLSCAFTNDKMNATNLTMDIDNVLELTEPNYNLYGTITFWGFVIFMCAGTVAFNVANCIGDAVCFDLLGPDNNMKYGVQRAWGTFGYGLTALISGLLVDIMSKDKHRTDFTPAFIIMIVFTVVDLFFCRKLELPPMSRPKDASGTLAKLFKEKTVIIFLIFAVLAGVFDSFILYYMFWYLEEMAKEQGNFVNIKFIEGLIIAVESFGGEILFFSISGKILKHLGFRNTLTFSLVCYAIRLFSISLITAPWHLVLIELFMQGPTYALCYSTIVGYAAAVAPPGLSATLQGVMAGMDDGVGFAIGSLFGGIFYKYFGGKVSFQLFSGAAFAAAAIHLILGLTILKGVPITLENLHNENAINIEEVGKLMKNPSNADGNTIIKSDVDVENNTNNCIAENKN